MTKKYAIVDFSTTEVVRGSFGYDSYLLYSAMKKEGRDVTMYEDMTPFKFHRLKNNFDEIIVHLWSYPQIDTVKWLEFNYSSKTKYIGYKPLIDKLGLPHSELWNNNTLLKGMENLPDIYDENVLGLMSDCSLHIKSEDTRPVMPLFLSYGCPNVCTFCPIPPNREEYGKHRRIELPIDTAKQTLDNLFKKDVNLHLCDEDMFLDKKWANNLIKHMSVMNKRYKGQGREEFKWIALASVPTFYKYLKEYGTEALTESGCHLVEIGIESTDAELRKGMKKTGSFEQVRYIVDNSKNINKFWLSVTLFPGETITTINKTGAWLNIYGTKQEDLEDRLITNGNVGGLGQFFQIYDGTKDHDKVLEQGVVLDNNPLRLMPSYVPDTFLDCNPKQIRVPTEKEKFWFNGYGVNVDDFKDIKFDGTKKVRDFDFKDKQFLVYLCLLARLGCVVE